MTSARLLDAQEYYRLNIGNWRRTARSILTRRGRSAYEHWLKTVYQIHYPLEPTMPGYSEFRSLSPLTPREEQEALEKGRDPRQRTLFDSPGFAKPVERGTR